MTAPPAATAANDVSPTSTEVGEALGAAKAQLQAASRHPAFDGDPVHPVLRALIATVSGFESVYSGLTIAARDILTTAERQHREFVTFARDERLRITKDLAEQHDAALSKVRAQESAHEAHVRAGLVDAAKLALGGLLTVQRRQTYARTVPLVAVPAALVLGLGFATGWYVREARGFTEVAASVQSLDTMSDALAKTSATLQAISASLTHGMTPAEILVLRNLADVISINMVAKVPDDTVPSPCIAAVPDGAIRTSANRPIKACVVALKDNATILGGAFLVKAVASVARSQ